LIHNRRESRISRFLHIHSINIYPTSSDISDEVGFFALWPQTLTGQGFPRLTLKEKAELHKIWINTIKQNPYFVEKCKKSISFFVAI